MTSSIKNSSDFALRASIKKFIANQIEFKDGIRYTIIPSGMIMDKGLSDAEYRTLCYLMHYNHKCATHYKGFVFINVGTMQSDFGLSERTVFDRLKSLQEKGYIYRISNNTVADYYECVEYLNQLFNLNIREASITFIDFWKCFSASELISYTDCQTEEDFLAFSKEREEFIAQLKTLSTMDIEGIHDFFTPPAENCTRGPAENCTPGPAENCTHNNTNTNSANTKNMYTHPRSNYFSSLLNTEVKKEDFDRQLSYKEAKNLRKQKQEKEKSQKKAEVKEEYNSKLKSNSFNSFTLDDLCMYYQDKLQSTFGKIYKVSDSAFRNFKILFETNFKSFGLTMEQMVKVVDVYIGEYRSGKIQGIDVETYPVPTFPKILMNPNGSILKQIMKMCEFTGPAPSNFSSKSQQTFTQESDYRVKIPELQNLWKIEKLKWMKKYGLEQGEPDRNYMKILRWLPDDEFSDYGITDSKSFLSDWIIKGYMPAGVKTWISDKSLERVTEYVVSVMIPAKAELKRITVQVHEKVYGEGTEIRVGGLI